jgi:hypothetical protein
MHFMTLAPDGGLGGPAGSSYCGIFSTAPLETFVTSLTRMRFSGWVGPQEDGWVVAVPSRVRGAVAGNKMTGPEVARAVSADDGGTAFCAIVLGDALLQLQAYTAGDVLLTYYSDPTVLDPTNDELMSDPMGADDAPALARAVGKPDVGDELEELLAEPLSESENESERLTQVLRLLGAPTWIVAADALPKDVPSGPRAKEFTRLGAGKEGVQGRIDDALRGIVRKKK